MCVGKKKKGREGRFNKVKRVHIHKGILKRKKRTNLLKTNLTLSPDFTFVFTKFVHFLRISENIEGKNVMFRGNFLTKIEKVLSHLTTLMSTHSSDFF